MKSKHSFNCALVTGATGGLGAEIVKRLKEEGIEVITTGRTSESLPIDLRASRNKLLELISEKKPDLVINNAGFGLYGETINLSTEEQLAMIEVNVKALVEISIHAAKVMLKANQEGTILNISSAAAYLHSPLFNVYHATKAFVKSFSLGLYAELREKNIHVLCACPGQIETSFRSRASKNYPQKKDHRTMSAKVAADHIWNQIKSGKRITLFDWRYKLLIGMSFLLPDAVVNYFLKSSLKKRIRSSSFQDT